MCTVTLAPMPHGFVLTMNRDERRERDEAGIHLGQVNEVKYCYPVDAQAGGTWVGLNNHGVAMALLNQYQAPTIKNARSRGRIIAEILTLGDITTIYAAMQTLDTELFNAFDCLLVSKTNAYQFSWDRANYRSQPVCYKNGFMLTSSSERLSEVQQHRQQRFTKWLHHSSSFQEIDRFHLRQHHEQARSDVFMARKLTHTKSLVQIKTSDTHCDLAYYKQSALRANTRLSQLKAESYHFPRVTNPITRKVS